MTTRSTRRTAATRLVSARWMACAAIMAALAAIAPAAAAAHTASYSSPHSISLSPAGFAGKLTSALADCAGGRSILRARLRPRSLRGLRSRARSIVTRVL